MVSIIGYNQGPRRAGLSFELHEREAEIRRRHQEQIARDAAEAPATVPRQGQRPSPRAQWDELRSCWIEWDREADDWKVVGDAPAPEQPGD